MSRTGNIKQFVDVFRNEFKWVENLQIEVVAGSPVIYATLNNGQDNLPLANVSSGINRIVSIMLAIASHPKAVALVDEMENGIYFRHHAALWQSTLAFARQFDSQLFITTHNEEWLKGLIEAAGDNNNDISLWRLEQSKVGIELFQFSGDDLKAGLEYGAEVRGSSE